jgi:heptose I phosphotransferase
MKLCLRPPFDRLWAESDPFTEVESLTGQIFRQLEGRKTFRTEIEGQGYFVKIHHGVGWREIFKNLLSARLPVLGAGNEWQAIERLGALGIDTLQGVAYGERGSNPARKTSFLITREITPSISLEDHCRDWPNQKPNSAYKRALIAQVAHMAGTMHRGGVNHRDFYLCHFLLRPPETQADTAPPSLSIIDLHRAQVRRKTPRRWRDKDLAGLYFSALAIGLTRRDELRFLRAYFRQPLRDVLQTETRLLNYLEHEAQRLHARYLRKYAPAEKS